LNHGVFLSFFEEASGGLDRNGGQRNEALSKIYSAKTGAVATEGFGRTRDWIQQEADRVKIYLLARSLGKNVHSNKRAIVLSLSREKLG
jgi:hypothetical protein